MDFAGEGHAAGRLSLRVNSRTEHRDSWEKGVQQDGDGWATIYSVCVCFKNPCREVHIALIGTSSHERYLVHSSLSFFAYWTTHILPR